MACYYTTTTTTTHIRNEDRNVVAIEIAPCNGISIC